MFEVLTPFKNVPEGSFYFLAGIVSYFAFQWVFSRPIRTYVFGHELSHAIAAWVSGAKVKHFKVSKRGGSVTVNKSNAFIALAPYIIPIYAMGVMGLYLMSLSIWPMLKEYWTAFLWTLGAAMGFHMALTAYALKMDQPDLKTAGKFLSGVLIYLGNALSLMFVLGVLFPRTISWSRFAKVSGQEAFQAVRHVGRGTQIVLEGALHGSAR